MPLLSDDIEGDLESPEAVLSMRTKMAIAGVVFFVVMGVVAYCSVPYAASLFRGLSVAPRDEGDESSADESQPPEQDTLPEENEPRSTQSLDQEEGLAAQVNAETPFPFLEGDRMILFRDDFVVPWYPWDSLPQREWSWWGSTGITYDAYMFLNLDEASSEYARRTMLYSKATYCPPAALEVRLRCSDDNKLMSGQGVGTKLWGWGSEDWWWECGPCFISISPESESPLPGLWVGHFDHPDQWIPITDIDITEWHTYSIVIEDRVPNEFMECSTIFLVDGEVVASTNVHMPPRGGDSTIPWCCTEMQVIVELDNAFYQTSEYQGRPREGGGLDSPVDQWVQIDYVDIYMGNETFAAVEEMKRIKGEEFPEVSVTLSRLGLILQNQPAGLDTEAWNSLRYLLDAEYGSALDAWLETQRLWERAFWGQDLEDDQDAYRRATDQLNARIGRLEDIAKDWDEIVALFSQVVALIGDAREQGYGDGAINLLEGVKAQGERHWVRLDSDKTRTVLEGILNTSILQEMVSRFEPASTAIVRAEQMGKHPSILAGMKTNFEWAISSAFSDDQRAGVYLDSILYTANQYFGIDIPEPSLLPFLPVLGPVLLPMILRRGSTRRGPR